LSVLSLFSERHRRDESALICKFSGGSYGQQNQPAEMLLPEWAEILPTVPVVEEGAHLVRQPAKRGIALAPLDDT